jgi:hypothetical protein
MWRGPMFLQIFASQLNATSSRVSISELGSEIQGYEGAMALAAAAVGDVPVHTCSICLDLGSSNARSLYLQIVTLQQSIRLRRARVSSNQPQVESPRKRGSVRW